VKGDRVADEAIRRSEAVVQAPGGGVVLSCVPVDPRPTVAAAAVHEAFDERVSDAATSNPLRDEQILEQADGALAPGKGMEHVVCEADCFCGDGCHDAVDRGAWVEYSLPRRGRRFLRHVRRVELAVAAPEAAPVDLIARLRRTNDGGVGGRRQPTETRFSTRASSPA